MASSNGSDSLESYSNFGRHSNADSDEDELMWAALEKLPSEKRTNFALLKRTDTIDVTKLDRLTRQILVNNALATSEQDNYKLLYSIKQRFNRVGLEIPKVEVRYENLTISTNVKVGSRALPTLLNYGYDVIESILAGLRIFKPRRHPLTILKNVTGIVKPGRMTLLLGPPGSGKSTLLLALSGKLDNELKRTGHITYNGHKEDEFCVQRTCAYISQIDNHIAELTVRETLDFAARCQGASHGFGDYMKDLGHLEKERKIRPKFEIDAYMKASSVGGTKHNVSTEYVLKVLGLDICSDTIVGNDMVRGISGGQRKRVTTGEMIVGPRKTLFMDEISTGLDSSTTFQIVKCIRNFVNLMEGTVMMALLQPAPETFELFDDLVLLSDGYVVYHGPRADVVPFFESLGFQLPSRKGVADFLQEVTSRKDQAQYWADTSRPYEFIPVEAIAEAFRNSRYCQDLKSSLSVPYDRSKSHHLALSKTKFAESRLELLKGCFSREMLLMSRNSFLYIFRTCQVAFMGFVTCTLFPKTRLHPTDLVNGNLYLSGLFIGLVHIMFNGRLELPLLILRLPVFYKQRDNFFYPAWAWSLSSWILQLPYSITEAAVWSCVVYWTVGFAPGAGRFFRYMLLLFSVHQMGMGLFRSIASLSRDIVIATTYGSAALLITFSLGGFLLPKEMIKPWWIWAFWVSPLSYGQRAISVNEFTATRWMEKTTSGNVTLGYAVLQSHSIPTSGYWYWLGVGVIWLYALLFNIILTVALAFLNPLKKSQAIIPADSSGVNSVSDGPGQRASTKKGIIFPFQPLTMSFHNVNYFVDMPKEMSSEGIPDKKLQLLSNVSGVFSPGVLTALVGSSGAGKTTLMDCLAGRKTSGHIEGDIRISGYPKIQETFARISGYVEQNDIHSPQVTVFESLWFSSYLRLPKEVNEKQRQEFVEEVMELVELDSLRYALVGLPGRSGLSTEQRKRLTIAVELVANPSIVFMDEPTSGLDARAAAIVMRTVRNTVDTGRTVVCTIHQPSIEIFEAFDELLLMKRGGQVIYGGKLGEKSQIMINYFQSIHGIPPIPSGYNPATWMLEISTSAAEAKLGEDFATIYRNSEQYRQVEGLIERLSVPPENSEPMGFTSKYSQGAVSQFKICLWKQNLVYWRNPSYNFMRLFFTTMCALLLGSLFWDVGSKRDSSQNLFVVMAALYASVLFLGGNNATSVQPVLSIERTVFYRERAAGMYSPLPYAVAQGIIEIPYVMIQTLIYGVITYFMINFEREAGKFFLYILFMFLTFMYFTFTGMMVISVAPTQHLAAIISSALFSLWNIMSGFIVPKPSIPEWWIWFYYINPVAWTVRGIISSQLGDVETRITGPGFDGTVKDYLEVRLGFGPGMIWWSAAMLTGFCSLFFAIYAASVKLINFQKR
nr:ABC transporter G family member 31-like isoform X2 [Solanum lycopersicum]